MAQLAPAGTGGVAALAATLRQLGSNKRVLMIGAHPDDEDTQLLVLLSRGMGAQAAYLSLTRGEGGQNLIGPELGPELGIIRTEELLAARQLDGAQQFFTRAYDFGFSKSADETFRFWPRDSILRDVLDVIRRFKPQIIIAVFSGTPADGHGHHQVSALLARQAFDLLRDSAGGPQKFYRSTRGDPSATTLTLPVGTLDPILGQSYFQIAMASRSRHRSQDMGQLQRLGPATSGVALLATKPGAGSREPGAGNNGESSLFTGVDTTIHVTGYAALIDSARAALTPWRPAASLPYLVRALHLLGVADSVQRSLLERAITIAAGITADGTADVGGLPFEPPPVTARVRLVIGGEPVTVTREVVYRYRDQAIGEVRRPLFVTRDVEVAITPEELLWPIDGSSHEARHFMVTVTNRARGPANVRTAVTAPTGWPTVSPESLAFTREDETRSVVVGLAPPAADSLKPG